MAEVKDSDKTVYGLLVKTNATYERVFIVDFRKALKGVRIERMPCGKCRRFWVYCDEEALLKDGIGFNDLGAYIINILGMPASMMGGLRGNILIVNCIDEKPLKKEDVEALEGACDQLKAAEDGPTDDLVDTLANQFRAAKLRV